MLLNHQIELYHSQQSFALCTYPFFSFELNGFIQLIVLDCSYSSYLSLALLSLARSH